MQELNLNRIALFDSLDDETLKIFHSQMKTSSLRKGEILCQAGDLCQNIYILKYGRIKMFRLSEEGKEQILDILESGDTCACHPGMVNWLCNSFLEVIEDSQVYRVDRSTFSNWIIKHRILSSNLNRIFAEKLKKFTLMIEDLSIQDVQTRLIHFLIQESKIHGIPTPHGIMIQLSLTRSDLGSQIGAARETVTRCIQHLKKLNYIEVTGKNITLINFNKLKELVSDH